MQNSDDKTSRRIFFTALRETFEQGYSLRALRGDALAGLTVGLVAVPLAMALAIAIGVSPQNGLYTSLVAGVVIALSGGSRFNISGPTAAFVVVLIPIVDKYGLGGLLITTVMAGMILMAMGIGRLGKLVQFIPYPVTLGFTSGIGVVIAALQLKDLLGMQATISGDHFIEKFVALIGAIPSAHGPDIIIGALTFGVLLGWPRLKTAVPAHLPALAIAAVVAWSVSMAWIDFNVETVGSRFHFNFGDVSGNGIPPLVPHFVPPWELADKNGNPIGLSFALIRELLPSAFAVALLGAIESLLCAVVTDGLTGTKHNPNGELIGQGLGNIAAPFFGGITATAAIARTTTNVRAGGISPFSAVVHGLTVLLAIVVAAPVLSYIPMAALAALLIMVAWNMSEARHFANVVRIAPRSDVAVLLTCFGLTILFDMVLAVGVGVVLASVLFIKRMTDITEATLIPNDSRQQAENLPVEIAVYDVNGPLFFGAAEKAMSVFSRVNAHVKVIIIDMADVPMIDITGIVALDSLVKKLNKKKVGVVLANLSPRIYRKLLKAGFRQESGKFACTTTLSAATVEAKNMLTPEQSVET